MCSVSNGSSPSYAWMKGSSAVNAGGRIQFSDEGATLTITSVTRDDEGPFKCNVSNLISHEVSLPVLLNVSYGPSNTKMMIMPTGYNHRTGSNITLSCSAESSPSAIIQWMLNGVYLDHFGPDLQLKMVKESDSGNYKCIFHNTVTSRFSSASAMIKIVEPLGAVLVNNTGGPAILDGILTLHCEVTGSVTLIQWCRDGQVLSADNSTMFGMGNKTLTLNPVRLSDKGEYQCEAFNEVSMVNSSPYTVEVNYGPKMATIMGPKAAISGDNVTLSCYASSNPSSSYMWFFNGTKVANTSEYVTPPLTSDMAGKYTCMAFNSITGKNSTAYKMLKVVEPIMEVKVEAPVHPAIEGHVYNLTCYMSGHAQHFYWMKNGQPLHEDNRTTFSMENKTVTFNPIQYNDTGKYQCVAFNHFMNMTSPPYKLYVNFGPKTPVVRGPSYAETGQVVNFDCYAQSVPPSLYSWWYNGSEVANTSVFKTSPLTLNMSGEYTCMAYNNITEKNSTSSQRLTVIEAIESVKITNNTVPILSKNFTLTCEVIGPYDSIYWMKDNMHLTMNTSKAKAKSYQFKDNMLHFTPVTRNHDGMYKCVATNKAKSHLSNPYALLVNYGPLTMTILGLDSAPVGLTALMKCSADSRPDSEFHWFYNDLSSPLMAGSVLSFPVTNDSDGTYICEARNPVTNITMYQTKEFTANAVGLHTQSKAALMMGLLALSVNVLFN
ncbi:cell adhesion molecule CEACAM5-like [Tautogolabrus adspersus]